MNERECKKKEKHNVERIVAGRKTERRGWSVIETTMFSTEPSRFKLLIFIRTVFRSHH